MRKKTRRSAASKTSRKQVLQLTRETVRTLSSEELSRVVQGQVWTCPTGTDTSTKQTTLN
jgi:hypothetical protein